MNENTSGYTLIELMVTLAVIGVLTLLAIPAYQHYIGRAQTDEALKLITPLKTEIHIYLETNGHMPSAADISPASDIGSTASGISGQYIAAGTVSVAANSGQISVPFSSGQNAGHTLTLTPELSVGNAATIHGWKCGGNIDHRHLPSVCRSDDV